MNTTTAPSPSSSSSSRGDPPRDMAALAALLVLLVGFTSTLGYCNARCHRGASTCCDRGCDLEKKKQEAGQRRRQRRSYIEDLSLARIATPRPRARRMCGACCGPKQLLAWRLCALIFYVVFSATHTFLTMASYTGTTHYLALILFAVLTVASACFVACPEHAVAKYLGPIGGILFYIVLVATVQTDLIFYTLLAPIANNVWGLFSLVVHGPFNLIFVYVELWLVDFAYYPSMAVFLFIPIEIYFGVWAIAMLADPKLWSYYWFLSFSWVTVILFLVMFALYLAIHVANMYMARCCREGRWCCNVVQRADLEGDEAEDQKRPEGIRVVVSSAEISVSTDGAGGPSGCVQ